MSSAPTALAVGDWARDFGWTALGSIAATALIGLAAASRRLPREASIREETGIHDAMRALLRAFVGNHSRADPEPTARIVLEARTSPCPAGTVAANAVPKMPMRSTDATIAEPKDVIAAALREAFDAGRAHKANELKAAMDAFLEGLVSGGG